MRHVRLSPMSQPGISRVLSTVNLLNQKEPAEILTSLIGSVEGPCVMRIDALWVRVKRLSSKCGLSICGIKDSP